MTKCFEALERTLANEEIIELDENYWNEYITLVFYILAFKKYYKVEKTTVLKYQFSLNVVLSLLSIIKESENNKIDITDQLKLIGRNPNDKRGFEIPIGLPLAKEILVNEMKKIPRFEFLPKTDKLLRSDFTLDDLLKIQEHLDILLSDYTDFIEMRGTTMLVNYLRSRVPVKKESQKITNDEIRFIIKTYKAVKLTAYSASENHHLNAFRIAYNRVSKRLIL